jgi:uncharacterized protein (DUF2141 family)
MRNKPYILLLFLIPGFLLIRCARPGSPTGGPEDKTPPSVRYTIPPNRSLEFKAKKITIAFNEFIELKDAAKEIFISPPMKIRPEFNVTGKDVIVVFQQELIPNSTYTINFGNAIVDFSAGNILVNYEYVFSTGDHLDSLSLKGKVINAFNEQPEADIVAMVYTDDNDTIPLDSLPLKVPPGSASKTIKDGSFSINNLAPGKYKLVALQDLNNNYIFDLPNERFAFIDSLITLKPPERHDSIAFDTIISPAIQILEEDTYTLRLFEEQNIIQKLLDKKMVGNHMLQYIFRNPVDSFNISLLNFQPVSPDWYMPEFNKTRDTLDFWLKPGLPDTIRVRFSIGDSLVDTTKFSPRKIGNERVAKRKEEAKEKMKFTSSVDAGTLDLNRQFNLYFPSPVMDYDSSRFLLYAPSDTLVPTFYFTGSLQRKAVVNYKWKEKEPYKLLIVDSAFRDLNGAYNDSVFISFKVKSMEDYGVLILDIKFTEKPGQYIIQLLNDKENIIREKILTKSGSTRFEYLYPGNYKLKSIFDANSNGKWDTGNFKKNILPELVEYYPLPLSVRANWDLEEEWLLNY